MFEAFWKTVDAVLSTGTIVIGFVVIGVVVISIVYVAYKTLS